MTLPSPFEYIPSEFHLAALFLVGIIGFFVVIRFTSVSAIVKTKGKKSPTKKSPTKKAAASPAKTPAKTPAKELIGKFGSVETPGGRRSARIAHSASKKGN